MAVAIEQSMSEHKHVRVGVGVVVLDGDTVLLIRRGKPPRKGEWSLPGGHIELGETLKAAAAREVMEETSLSITVRGLVDVVDLIDVEGTGEINQHYALIDYWGEYVDGTLQAGSDAADAAWHKLDDIGFLRLWSETERIIFRAVKMRDEEQ
jgi:8-oxo-dGTP diphosphatase